MPMALPYQDQQPEAGPGGRPGNEAGPGGRHGDEPEVIAAIAAAVELCWPRRAAAAPEREPRVTTPAWRFSGRWWTKPPQLRRDRPWAEP